MTKHNAPSGKYILALDQGTTSSRAMVFNHSGDIVSIAQEEFRQIYPQPGWVEHDPLDIWSSQSSTAAGAISKANLETIDIAAVGITNQRETTIVWDKESGKPIYNAIVWQDRRTAEYCDQLKAEGVEIMITGKTGLRIDPYFSATKIRWILDHVNGARERATQGKLLFGTVDSWLLWQLTRRQSHSTDITNASRTLLFNIHTGEWDEDLLALFEIPRAMLPEVKSCSENFGVVGKNLYPAGAPITGIAGDQQSALFGQNCFSPGMAKNTYGTGCFLLMNTGEKAVPSKNNLLTTIAWKIGSKTEFALEGSVFIGGAIVQWLRDELQMVKTAQELDQIAASVKDAGGLFIIPAFSGLGAPHWDPYARGTAFGITRGTNRAHFCRAALESIALQSADLLSCMQKDSGIHLKELRVDGGVSKSEPMLQFQADILDTVVIRPKITETTALGAAYLAGLAVGYWENREDIAQSWAIDKSYERQRSAAEMDEIRSGWNDAIRRSLGWETTAHK